MNGRSSSQSVAMNRRWSSDPPRFSHVVAFHNHHHDQGTQAMKVLFINNDGGGFADHIEIESGTTARALFEAQLPHAKPADYLIRINRQPATADQKLHEGDRISCTPTKIEGAYGTAC